MIGIQARGGATLGGQGAKLVYAVWFVNAPGLLIQDSEDGHDDGHDHGDGEGGWTGLLDFESDAGEDNPNTRGARVGLFPVPWVELGVSYWGGRASPGSSDLGKQSFRLHGVDFVAQLRDREELGGHVELRGEWVWSIVDSDELPHDNNRNGGYVQLAHRPQLADGATVLNDFEFVLRYDRVNAPGGSPQNDTSAWTLGVDYWLSPSSVLKLAGESRRRSGASDDSVLLFEWAMGF
jgi:hypothetical protein